MHYGDDKHGGVDAPISLGGLFADSDDDDEDGDGFTSNAFEQISEIQTLEIAGMSFEVEQLAYHSHNANKVWPGTFALAEYIKQNPEMYPPTTAEPGGGLPAAVETTLLEVGSATGAMAMALQKMGHSVVTSDLDDQEVTDLIAANFRRNDLPVPEHIPHTWGTEWPAERAGKFSTIVASDILLYINAYPALVQTLLALFASTGCGEFLMVWNRRMKESSEFFERMDKAGFGHEHLGQCIHRFVQPATGGGGEEPDRREPGGAPKHLY